MNIVPPLLLLVLLIQMGRRRHVVAGTSLRSSLAWAVAAVSLLLLTSIVHLNGLSSLKAQSALQYASAVLLLTPLIDILGARRPGHRAWPWFVLLPLIAILHWPILSQLVAGSAEVAVEVPTPTFVGFLFILLMGTGNYFGTSFTAASFMAAVGIVLTALPVTEWVAFPNPWCLTAGSLSLLIASLMVAPRATHSSTRQPEERLHRELWADFRDIYGMVWAKRVMDRVNQFAARESWPAQMTLDGFSPTRNSSSAADNAAPASLLSTGTEALTTAGSTEDDEISDRPLQVLCWVLGRFVDPAFLLQYLPESLVRPDSLNTR